MSRPFASHLLGLGNLVAGALLVWGRSWLMPGLDGIASPAATLMACSLGLMLWAVAAGAWLMPASASRGYLAIFGVALKGVAALIWAWTAVQTGVTALWVGAGLDLALAVAIAASLRYPRDAARRLNSQ